MRDPQENGKDFKNAARVSFKRKTGRLLQCDKTKEMKTHIGRTTISVHFVISDDVGSEKQKQDK